jgi:flagellin
MKVGSALSADLYNNYSVQSRQVADNVQQAASGERVDTVADGPAGMAVSSKMTAEVRGLNMAARSARDASSLIRTAEGGMSRIQDALQRMNELAVRGADGTLAAGDRGRVDLEYGRLKREINDISERTTFNGMKILDGSLSSGGQRRSAETVGIRVRTADRSAQTVMAQSVETPDIVTAGRAGGRRPVAASTAAFSGSLRVGDTFQLSGKKFELVVPGGIPQTAGASRISIFAAQTNEDVVRAMRESMSAQFKDTFQVTSDNNEIRIEQKSAGKGDTALQMEAAPQRDTSVRIDVGKLQTGDQIELSVTDASGRTRANTYTHTGAGTMDGVSVSLLSGTDGTSRGSTLNFVDSDVSVSFSAAQSPGENLMIQAGPMEEEQLAVGIDAMNTAGLGLDASNLATQDAAGAAVSSVRGALDTVSDQSAALGAVQNRLGDKMSDLQQTAISMTEAESRIADVDIAEQAMRNSQLGVRSQGYLAMQAQANSQLQNVLSLLR